MQLTNAHMIIKELFILVIGLILLSDGINFGFSQGVIIQSAGFIIKKTINTRVMY